MSILDHFDLNQAATITRPSVVNDGFDNPVTTFAPVGVFDCLLWEGSTGEAYVGERFKEQVSATAAFYPDVDVEKDDVVEIAGVEYHVIGVDNVGRAGQVVVVALQERT